jgi:branched-chain amino acid transport system substrate-binding protein
MKKPQVFLCVLALPVALATYVALRRSSDLRDMLPGLKSNEVLVGVAWPFALNQDGMYEGLTLAAEELNRKGVAGKRIRLLMKDDELDRDTSRKLAIEFAENPRMTATIGYYDDKFAVRASAIFEENHLLHIVAGGNNTYMTTHGFRYLVRSVLNNQKIGRKLALMAEQEGFRKFAVVAEQGAFGEDLAYQTCSALDTADGHVVYQGSYVPGKVEFRDTVDAIKEAGADSILFLGFEREGAIFVKTARTMGVRTVIVGSFSDTPLMHEIAGDALEGTMFYDLYDVNSPTPENQAFVAAYRRRFGADPDTYAAQGYDSLRILGKALELTHSTNGLDLAYAIRYMDRWEGANGSYDFDSRGELQDKNIYLKVYRGGKPAVIRTSQSVDPVAPVANREAPVPN